MEMLHVHVCDETPTVGNAHIVNLYDAVKLHVLNGNMQYWIG